VSERHANSRCALPASASRTADRSAEACPGRSHSQRSPDASRECSRIRHGTASRRRPGRTLERPIIPYRPITSRVDHADSSGAAVKLTADFQFVFDPDGTVHLEVRRNYRECWNEQRLARKTGLLRPPLRTFPDSDFEITPIGSRHHPGLPYIRVRVLGSGIWESQAGKAIRFLHFTVDGPDRSTLQALARQDEVRVIWTGLRPCIACRRIAS
jgi:hypothetical protein